MRPRENDTHGSDNRCAMPVAGSAVLTVAMSYALYRMRHCVTVSSTELSDTLRGQKFPNNEMKAERDGGGVYTPPECSTTKVTNYIRR